MNPLSGIGPASTVPKFGRTYKLTVEFYKSDDPLGLPPFTKVAESVYTPPFTLDFETNQASFSQANMATLQIYNLNENERNLLRLNKYTASKRIFLTLQSGYLGDMGVVFNGTVQEAWSARQGVDFITYISCFDGGYMFQNAFTNAGFSKGTSRQTVINSLINSLQPYGVTKGKITTYSGSLSKDTAYSGNTAKLLSQETNGAFFVSNGVANCINGNEVIKAPPMVITAETGLLDTPRYQQSYIDLDMLFEPKVQMLQQVTLNSVTAPNYNGTYKVMSIQHRAMISPVVAGEAKTTVGLFAGNFQQIE